MRRSEDVAGSFELLAPMVGVCHCKMFTLRDAPWLKVRVMLAREPVGLPVLMTVERNVRVNVMLDPETE